tara:strand:- start:238 stop:1440 length:1203 start_codon:yes stop_codon:yes gene_type:complete
MEENKTPVTEVTEQPKVDDKVEKLTVKKKSKKIFEQPKDNIVKVNMTETPPEKPEENITKVDLTKAPEKPEAIEEVKKEVVEEVNKDVVEEVKETPVLEEIKVEKKPEVIEEVSTETIKPKLDLPENIQKVVDFVNETGGTLEDYVNLNKNYDEMDQDLLLKEYYRETKPHLNEEEISFMLEDTFSYDSEVDDPKEIKRKQLALKEQVASAKSHLDGLRSKYYDKVQAGSGLSESQKEAIEFFNRYKKESEEQKALAEKQVGIFNEKTNNVFNDEFKGFEYKVGDKKFRFNVKDVDKVKSEQSDLNNFVKKFLNDKMEMANAADYHKSLFTANNSDAIANHFYEQGRADALKDSVANAKNIDMAPRQAHGDEQKTPGGMTFRVVGDSSDDFKFQIKKRRK